MIITDYLVRSETRPRHSEHFAKLSRERTKPLHRPLSSSRVTILNLHPLRSADLESCCLLPLISAREMTYVCLGIISLPSTFSGFPSHHARGLPFNHITEEQGEGSRVLSCITTDLKCSREACRQMCKKGIMNIRQPWGANSGCGEVSPSPSESFSETQLTQGHCAEVRFCIRTVFPDC